MEITEKKRKQIIEMWNCGKRVGKISRELRVSGLEVLAVIEDLYKKK